LTNYVDPSLIGTLKKTSSDETETCTNCMLTKLSEPPWLRCEEDDDSRCWNWGRIGAYNKHCVLSM